jgi:two-component system KDP operon response regulator KdpE
VKLLPPARPTILVIDDDVRVRRTVFDVLTESGCRVVEAPTGKIGTRLAAVEDPSVVVLDLALPDVPGIDVCREIRSRSRTPIIVLSGQHGDAEKVELLLAGADDYVTKPFSLRELEARVQVQLRRAQERPTGLDCPTPEQLDVDGLRADFVGHRVSRDGAAIHLTGVEWRLFAALVANAGRTVTHRELFDTVWKRPSSRPQVDLRVHITHLRRKIERDPTCPVLIVTEPGVGYRFELSQLR